MSQRLVPELRGGPPLGPAKAQERFAHLKGRGESIGRLLLLPLEQEPDPSCQLRMEMLDRFDIGGGLDLEAHVGDAALAGEGVDRRLGGLVVHNQRSIVRDRIQPRPAPASPVRPPDGGALAMIGSIMELEEPGPGEGGHGRNSLGLLRQQRDPAARPGFLPGGPGRGGAIILRFDHRERLAAQKQAMGGGSPVRGRPRHALDEQGRAGMGPPGMEERLMDHPVGDRGRERGLGTGIGGIHANDTQPAAFLYDNLMIEANIIHAAYKAGVEKLMFLGSSCIYPRLAPQPIPEEALLTGPLESTNEWYAIAKIAGIKLCQAYRKQYGADFISAMPTNLYGPGDNFDLTSSHVVPALIRKAHEAKLAGATSMEIWGSGTPRREFLHVDDCADAIVFLMKSYDGFDHINVGSGEDVTIEELARLVMKVVGFEGVLTRDLGKPDGTPRKLMSADRLRALGWAPSITLEEGIRQSYSHWLAHGGSDTRRLSTAS